MAKNRERVELLDEKIFYILYTFDTQNIINRILYTEYYKDDKFNKWKTRIIWKMRCFYEMNLGFLFKEN